MGRAILWIVIGIGIIIFNAASETTKLVIRGTKIDFGYLALIVGGFYLVKALVSKPKPKAEEKPEEEKKDSAKQG